VEAIVRTCSDSLTTDPRQKAPWRTRKDSHLTHLAQADRSTRLVAAADKLHNLQSLLDDLRRHGPQVWTRFNLT
jgi:(p)ppGpp synthase/HD superfamily hydrolase